MKATTAMKKATTTMKKRKSGSKEGKGGDSPSQLIDARIKELSDWRGETLARVRILIKQADPEVVEEWKWRGVPVWSHAGTICTGETYRNVVKMTFAKGASLEAGLFNCKNWYSISRTMPDYVTHRDNADVPSVRVRQAPRLRRAAMRRWGLTARRGRASGQPCRHTNLRCSQL
jgi:hypothetical protein